MNLLSSSSCSYFFFRLRPGQDVRKTLSTYCQENNISAGSMVSAVGSLSRVKIRKAASDFFYESQSAHEILTLSGLVSSKGVHLHISVADSEAQVFGGHLSEGNIVFTTLEVVLASYADICFDREFDKETLFQELVIRTAKP